MTEITKELIDKMVEEADIYAKDGVIELFRDRGDELSVELAQQMIESDDPYLDYTTYMEDAADEYFEQSIIYGFDTAHNKMDDELWDFDEDELFEAFRDRYIASYDEKEWNDSFKVNIMLDTGNMNYDFACDNVLNYCGNGFIDSNSSILWLARQFRKENDLRKAVGRYMKGKKIKKDKFIESCIEEFENLSSHMGTLTFLLEMPILDIAKIRKAQIDKREGYIEVPKDVMCGLFNDWDGAGSMLEIQLDHSIKIPISMIGKMQVEGRLRNSNSCYRWTVDETYGLVGSCWKEAKKISVKGA